METWWQELTFINKALFASAVFFTLLFIWQLISTILGFDADTHGDMHVEGFDAGDDIPDMHDSPSLSHTGHVGDTPLAHADDLSAGQITYSLVTIRSIIAFGTLFSWASAIFLASGSGLIVSIVIGLIWGLVAMFLVSFLLYKLVQMQEIGTRSLVNAIGEEALVYINIPSDGPGQVRVTFDGAVSYVKAASAKEESIPAGTRVRVIGLADENTLKVEEMDIHRNY
jgi:membrane protein implicated in regulation of membrane protease activity